MSKKQNTNQPPNQLPTPNQPPNQPPNQAKKISDENKETNEITKIINNKTQVIREKDRELLVLRYKKFIAKQQKDTQQTQDEIYKSIELDLEEYASLQKSHKDLGEKLKNIQEPKKPLKAVDIVKGGYNVETLANLLIDGQKIDEIQQGKEDIDLAKKIASEKLIADFEINSNNIDSFFSNEVGKHKFQEFSSLKDLAKKNTNRGKKTTNIVGKDKLSYYHGRLLQKISNIKLNNKTYLQSLKAILARAKFEENNSIEFIQELEKLIQESEKKFDAIEKETDAELNESFLKDEATIKKSLEDKTTLEHELLVKQLWHLLGIIGCFGIPNFFGPLTDALSAFFDAETFGSGVKEFIETIPVLGDISKAVHFGDLTEIVLDKTPIINDLNSLIFDLINSPIGDQVTSRMLSFVSVGVLVNLFLGGGIIVNYIDDHTQSKEKQRGLEKKTEDTLSNFGKEVEKKSREKYKKSVKDFCENIVNLEIEEKKIDYLSSYIHKQFELTKSKVALERDNAIFRLNNIFQDIKTEDKKNGKNQSILEFLNSEFKSENIKDHLTIKQKIISNFKTKDSKEMINRLFVYQGCEKSYNEKEKLKISSTKESQEKDQINFFQQVCLNSNDKSLYASFLKQERELFEQKLFNTSSTEGIKHYKENKIQQLTQSLMRNALSQRFLAKNQDPSNSLKPLGATQVGNAQQQQK